ncbi:MAG: YitT family protein [Oscillospiraceae bacterium]|nr:YitT family protein [Oscillospiraceae bacterium]
MKKGFIKLLWIALGSVIMGAGVSLFISPVGIVPGGVTGVAIVLGRLFRKNVGSLILIMNLPLLAVAVRKFGKSFFFATLTALLLSSCAIDIIATLRPVTDDMMIASLAGGGLVGLGVGIIFRCRATTGGIDIVVRLIKEKIPHIKTGNVFLVTDGAIALLSGVVLGNWELVVYSVIAIASSATVMNFVLYGMDESKLLIIVTSDGRKITEALTEKLGAGVSIIDARGGYTGEKRSVLICAVRNQSFYKAKELVCEADKTAFVMVASADSIYGEGFKAIDIQEI